MKLREWQLKEGLTSTQLAELCNVSRATIHAWRNGVIPTGVNMARITTLTGGKVTVLDFVNSSRAGVVSGY